MKTMLCLTCVAAAAAFCAAQDTSTSSIRTGPEGGAEERAQDNATGALRAQETVTYEVPSLSVARKHASMIRLAAGLIASGLAQAKAHGMTVDQYATFTGEQFAVGWPKDVGFAGYVRGVLGNFESWRQEGDPAIAMISQSESAVKFKVYNSWLHAFRDGEVMGMTLAEFYRWCDGVSQRIAAEVGCQYAQVIEGDYMIITLTKGAAAT